MKNTTIYQHLTLPQNNETSTLPISEYEPHKCLCFRVAYFPIAKIRVIEHWKINLTMPLISIIFFMVTIGLFIYDTWCTYPTKLMKILSISITCFSFLCGIMSYFLTIGTDPGYLPYNWALTRRNDYTWEEKMSNFAIYKKQCDFVKTAEKPRRACYSNEARRIVLRADHFCLWTKTWIGMKNHRYFMLLCFWISIYCLCNIGFRYYFWVNLVKNKFNWRVIFGLVSVFCLLYFCFISSYQFIVAFINLSKNRTMIEVWKGSFDQYDIGCFNNFTEVCGKKSTCILWIFPFFCIKPVEDGFYRNYSDSLSFVT